MKVLIACEESQIVCMAFREKGHEAYSCDILTCSGGHPEWHIKNNIQSLLCSKDFYTQDGELHIVEEWDLIIAHPPCTRLSNSGVRWLYERNLWKELKFAIWFFNNFKSRANKVCIENPIPHKFAKYGFCIDECGTLIDEQDQLKCEIYSNGIGDYDQIIQPWQFGHGETKATCLWLKGLPKLKPTNIVEGREQKIWKMAPSPERSKLRSKTFPGIAKAMAYQFSEFMESGMSVKEWEKTYDI